MPSNWTRAGYGLSAVVVLTVGFFTGRFSIALFLSLAVVYGYRLEVQGEGSDERLREYREREQERVREEMEEYEQHHEEMMDALNDISDELERMNAAEMDL